MTLPNLPPLGELPYAKVAGLDFAAARSALGADTKFQSFAEASSPSARPGLPQSSAEGCHAPTSVADAESHPRAAFAPSSGASAEDAPAPMLGFQNGDMHDAQHKIGSLAKDCTVGPLKALVQLSQSLLDHVSNMQQQQQLMQQQLHLQQQQVNLLRKQVLEK